ncbi:MAG: Gfo/Idh/MocA family oxidoreductase, partial [Candidatus Omnitrophica bacterium]|nr:Gfo/Idh/MocA family oxidoreductase [Candidatus Omnitrophota bacterium]
MINFGVIGYGYWGPNIVRNISGIKGACVRVICDKSTKAQKRAKTQYPHIDITGNYKDVVSRPDIDAVAIVTPLSTHYPLAHAALINDKHIFIEKPFTATAQEAQRLIKLADQKKKVIMVDHTFLFTGPVRKIQDIVKANTLGNLYYYDATRVNLGLFQPDTNVVWDLAPHDFSIIDYVIKNKPKAITAHGMDHMGQGHENIAY